MHYSPRYSSFLTSHNSHLSTLGAADQKFYGKKKQEKMRFIEKIHSMQYPNNKERLSVVYLYGTDFSETT